MRWSNTHCGNVLIYTPIMCGIFRFYSTEVEQLKSYLSHKTEESILFYVLNSGAVKCSQHRSAKKTLQFLKSPREAGSKRQAIPMRPCIKTPNSTAEINMFTAVQPSVGGQASFSLPRFYPHSTSLPIFWIQRE